MIADPERAGNYRKSFRVYTEDSLFISAFFFALTSIFFLGIFLIKYKIEFLISFPFFAVLFAWYQYMAIQPNSIVMKPELLYRQPGFLIYVVFLNVLVITLFFIEIPAIQYLMDHSVIKDLRIR